MLSLPPAVQIYVASEPADMRKSFNGLTILVDEALEKNPLSGHLFVFRNRRGDRLKILYWDRSGFCIWYKLLERGSFHLPTPGEAPYVKMSSAELSLLLEGIDLSGARRRLRYKIPA